MHPMSTNNREVDVLVLPADLCDNIRTHVGIVGERSCSWCRMFLQSASNLNVRVSTFFPPKICVEFTVRRKNASIIIWREKK